MLFGKDKRKDVRIAQRFRIDAIVVDPSQETPFKLDAAWSKDVAGSGIGLVTTVHCRVGAVIDLHFQLPNRKEPVYAKGRVVWSKLEDNSDTEYRVGIAFDSISGEDREAIKNFVNEEAGKSTKKGV